MNDKTNVLGDEKIVVTVDDCVNLKNYSKYFQVPFSPEFISALEAFEGSQSFSNQKEVLRTFCEMVKNHPHETFKDPLWDKPKEVATEILPELQFDKNVDNMLEGQKNEQENDKKEDATES